MRYVLGVDGGGTKTHCALYDADTGRLDMLQWGPTSHEVLSGGFTELRTVMRDMFRSLLTRNNIIMADIEYGVLGIAGIDTPDQHKVISTILSELGLQRFLLCNDTYLGIKAGSANGTGVCAVNGTGSCVVGMDAKGHVVQIGGLGTYTADFGGGNRLGPSAVGKVYGQLFRGEPYTELTTSMFRWLDITDKYEFIPLVLKHMEADRAKTMLTLCKMLFETAALGDPAALDILETSGKSYAGAIIGAIGELSFLPDELIDITFVGSLFAKSACRHIQETAETLVRQRLPAKSLSFQTLSVPAVAGALLWALTGLGVDGHRDTVLRLLTSGVWL